MFCLADITMMIMTIIEFDFRLSDYDHEDFEMLPPMEYYPFQ